MPNSERAHRLNGPMEARIRQCAADTSSNWDGKITIYPPEARELVDLIDEVRQLRSQLDVRARNEARLVNAFESLIQDTDGGDVDPDADIPAGEIRRVFHEATVAFRPSLSGGETRG